MDIIHLSNETLTIYAELIPKCLKLFEEGFGHLREFNAEVMRRQLECGEVSWYVGLGATGAKGAEPISAAIYYPRSPPFRLDTIWSLCTRRDMRRRGYARLLLQHIRASTRNSIFMKADTPELAAFYRSLGFVSM